MESTSSQVLLWGKKASWATNEHLRTSFIQFVEAFAQQTIGIDVKAKVAEALSTLRRRFRVL